jgi:uncharacterized Zn finger protein (UPF0148 family)
MSITFVSIKCPECGAEIPIEEGRKCVFCSYCGTKVFANDDDKQDSRQSDEARLKEAETEYMLQKRKIELEERRREKAEKRKKTKIKITIALIIALVIFIVIGLAGEITGYTLALFSMLALAMLWNKEDEEEDLGDKARVPSIVSDFRNENYAAVESAFVARGFTNVRTVALHDVSMGVLKKPGKVASVTVNGQDAVSGKKVSKQAIVVISYHSYR